MLFCDNNLGIALASQAACPLFAKLSLELRNQIYEHVFTTDEATDKDLETAKASEHGATCYLLANVVDTLHDRELALIQKVIISCDHRNDLREWHLTARGDCMQGWIASTRFADEAKAFSLQFQSLARKKHILRLATHNTERSSGGSAERHGSADRLSSFPPVSRTPRHHYGLVFGDGVVDGRIHLEDAQRFAPQSALTLTCRRVHDEATQLHQIAYAAYWMENVFRYVYTFACALPVLTLKMIEHMTHVVQHRQYGNVHLITELSSCPGHGKYDLVYIHGTLGATSAGPGRPQVGFERRDNADWRWVRTVRSTEN
ncbi:hypothetical protein Q7P35_003790 [Cladosporium inversicolor]